MKSYYQRPEDNCCRLYRGKDFKYIYDEKFCWDLKTGKALVQKKTKGIKSIDCGKNTYADFTTVKDVTKEKGFKIGFAGRQHFNLEDTWRPNDETINFSWVTVGPYNSKKMPAATLWRGDCDALP